MSSKLQIKNPKSQIAFRPGLHAFAVTFVVLTFCLLVLGGIVTSKGVGLSVPDWPKSLGHNMFLLPPSMWKGGVYYEHTHRLLASLIGMLSIVVCILLWVTQSARPWLRWFGVATLLMVIAQGVMGGLRVIELSEVWGAIHGITGQVFLCMTVVIAAATSRWWIAQAQHGPGSPERPVDSAAIAQSEFTRGASPAANPSSNSQFPNHKSQISSPAPRRLSLALLGIIFAQIVLGAAVRHSGSGLAIPDFPAAYGHLLPPLDQTSLDAALARIPYDKIAGGGDVTPLQVGINFAHRVWALAVVLGVLWVATRACLAFGTEPAIVRPALALVGLVLLQVALGAAVVWSGRHPEVATAHQAVGAVTFATATLLALRVHRHQPAGKPTPAAATPATSAAPEHGTGPSFQEAHA